VSADRHHLGAPAAASASESIIEAKGGAETKRAGDKSHLKVAGKMLGIAICMFGFGYLMVPMYNIICDITGLNGKTGRVTVESVASSTAADDREDEYVVAQATPSVTPFAAAKHFNKTECFCFTRQPFEGKGSKDMPITFIIEEDLPINVDRVTLSYTFFRSPEQGAEKS